MYTAEEASQSHYGGDEFSTDVTLDQETRSKIAEVDASLAKMSAEEIEALNADPAAVPPPAPGAPPPQDPAAPLPTSTKPGGEDPVIEASVALNGAQVTALLDVINKVANRLLPREVGVNVIANAFNLETSIVETMFGVVGATFFVEPKPIPPALRGNAGNEDAWHADTVEKRGSKWVVLSTTGKLLGTHDTEKEARDQLRAIEAAKAARGDSTDTKVSPLRFTRFDQALHHTHWDPEQNDFMGPEAIDPVTGDHVHERPDGSKSLPARTGVPHNHPTSVGPSGESVPWFLSEKEQREHFLEQMSMDASHPTGGEPAFCDKDGESYDAARCKKWRQSRQS